VDLSLTSDNDRDLRLLTERIREETSPDSKGWFRLSLLLLKIGQSEKAQQLCEIMLQQTFDDGERACIYNQLGNVKYSQGQYQGAITFYEQALEITQKTHPPTRSDFTTLNNSIGAVYQSMGEYSKVLSYFEKSLKSDKRLFHPPTLIWLTPTTTSVRCMTIRASF
jgi:tetratricopeptide (TPR) repeat protein